MQPTAKAQILVDVSRIAQGDARSGVQRVVRAILRQLLLAPPEGYDVVPVRAGRWRGYRYAASHCRTLVGFDHPLRVSGAVRARAGDLFVALDLAPGILPRHSAQLSAWKRCGVKFYFFVHDLLPLFYPAWFTSAGVRNYAAWMQSLVTHADGAICSTQSVADEFSHWLRSKAANRKIAVDWIHLGADIGASAPSTGLPAGFDQMTSRMRARPVVLMVGTIEPRKGHAQALSAFEILWQQGWSVNLAIVGNIGWKVDELVRRLRGHPEMGERLFWLEGASDEALCNLYRLANGVLMASEGEGFGLPLVEAARFGKPILARDIPVYREIAGAHARFFSGGDPNLLARELGAWVDAIQQGIAPSPSGIQTSTWAESARRIYEVLIGKGHREENFRQPPGGNAAEGSLSVSYAGGRRSS